MAVVDVRIPRHGAGAQFIMACARIVTVTTEGDVAKVYETDDRRAAYAAYVWRNPLGNLVVEPATMIEPSWLTRLTRTLHQQEGSRHDRSTDADPPGSADPST